MKLFMNRQKSEISNNMFSFLSLFRELPMKQTKNNVTTTFKHNCIHVANWKLRPDIYIC